MFEKNPRFKKPRIQGRAEVQDLKFEAKVRKEA